MAQLNGKSIIVTGGGSGVGRAASLLLARSGARVVVADRDAASAGETVALVLAEGGVAIVVRVDISQEDEVRAMVRAAVDAFGRLDGALNNAAMPHASLPIEELPLEKWQRVVDVNLTGTFLCLKHEIAVMLQSGGGSIVNTASTAGVVAIPMAAEYVSTKHAVIGLTRSTAIDYGRKGIRVNAILPGAVRTPMLTDKFAEDPGLGAYLASVHPIGRFSEPEEIAAAAVWLLSDESSFVTGSCMAVDGGYTAA